MPPTRLLITLIFCVAAYCLSAQETRQYSFTHYGANEGLASNEGRAVLHDDYGFVWVGTNNGLQRYDGSRFITLRHE